MKAARYAAGDKMDYTPTVAVEAGDVVVLNDRMVGIADKDIAADAKGALSLEGIYEIVKETGAIVVGEDVYWDKNAEVAFAGIVAAGSFAPGVYIGKCVEDTAADDETVKVKLERVLETSSGTATGTGTPGDDL